MKLAKTSASSVRGYLLVWLITSRPVISAAATNRHAHNLAETFALNAECRYQA